MNVAAPTDEEGFFSELLDSVAPNPGDLIVLINSYIDESYNDDLLCVAGYTMTSAQARALDSDWRRMLFRYRLPYFRMSACNAGQDPFDHLDETECIAVATEAIALIGKHVAFGYAVTVDQKAFNTIVTPKGFVGTPYEFCAWLAFTAIKTQLKTHMRGDGKTAFFFEAGFRDQGPANRMMNRIFNTPELKAAYNYKAHSFVDKVEVRPTQAADLLSWQWYKDWMRKQNGATKPHGDLVALFKAAPHYTIHANADRLQLLIANLNRMSGTTFGNELAGAAMRDPDHPLFPKEKGRQGDPQALADWRLCT